MMKIFLSTPSARRATTKSHLFSCLQVISIHALREEGDRVPCGIMATVFYFYPRPPRGGRLLVAAVGFQCHIISIHALREEGDILFSCSAPFFYNYFYPRPPRGGRPELWNGWARCWKFLSTPSARRATGTVECCANCTVISIHALREEGDAWYNRPITKHKTFLSTPSARRATAKTETKSLFSNKLYNILHEFRRALIYNGSKSYPNHAK